MATQESHHDNPPAPSSNHCAPTSPTRSFKKPSVNQNASPLMSLPTEIRLTILRELLKHPRPFLSVNRMLKEFVESMMSDRNLKGHVLGRESTQYLLEDSFQLWPAVMSACQGVYVEAYEILYHENQMQLTIQTEFCSRRGTGQHVTTFVHSICQELIIGDFRSTDSLNPAVRDFVLRFKNLKLDLNIISWQGEFRVECIFIGGVIASKQVKAIHSNPFRFQSYRSRAEIMDCFQSLRLAGFMFFELSKSLVLIAKAVCGEKLPPGFAKLQKSIGMGRHDDPHDEHRYAWNDGICNVWCEFIAAG